MSKRIIYTQGSVEYLVEGNLGCWCSSFNEPNNLPVGTVRVIGGELMSLYRVDNESSFGRFALAGVTLGLSLLLYPVNIKRYLWVSVSKKEYQDIRDWIDRLNYAF